jgi:hypothetical protein
MRTNASQVIASLVPCVMLTRQGTACGKEGQEGLPAGVCPEHAIEVYRAVGRMVDARRAKEAVR